MVDGSGHDGVGLDFNKGALGIDSLQQKILKVRVYLYNSLNSVLILAPGQGPDPARQTRAYNPRYGGKCIEI